MARILDDCGPWVLTDEILYDKHGVRIYGTTDPDYVIKVRENGYTSQDELGALFAIRRHGLTYSVQTPDDPYNFFGMTLTGKIWFAMQRYGGSIADNVVATRSWRRVGQNVLAFLMQLHRSCHLVHMDIKVTNVLYNSDYSRFVVSDYELCYTPNRRLTRTYGDDFRYYYLALGAELDQPLYSWRMDLTALGYMLALMTWNTESHPLPTFQTEMYRRRDEDDSSSPKPLASMTDDELVALREREMSVVRPSIAGYLQLVATLPWNKESPPSEEFYRELASFFD